MSRSQVNCTIERLTAAALVAVVGVCGFGWLSAPASASPSVGGLSFGALSASFAPGKLNDVAAARVEKAPVDLNDWTYTGRNHRGGSHNSYGGGQQNGRQVSYSFERETVSYTRTVTHEVMAFVSKPFSSSQLSSFANHCNSQSSGQSNSGHQSNYQQTSYSSGNSNSGHGNSGNYGNGGGNSYSSGGSWSGGGNSYSGGGNSYGGGGNSYGGGGSSYSGGGNSYGGGGNSYSGGGNSYGGGGNSYGGGGNSYSNGGGHGSQYDPGSHSHSGGRSNNYDPGISIVINNNFNISQTIYNTIYQTIYNEIIIQLQNQGMLSGFTP